MSTDVYFLIFFGILIALSFQAVYKEITSNTKRIRDLEGSNNGYRAELDCVEEELEDLKTLLIEKKIIPDDDD